jgi:hypothetical protein
MDYSWHTALGFNNWDSTTFRSEKEWTQVSQVQVNCLLPHLSYIAHLLPVNSSIHLQREWSQVSFNVPLVIPSQIGSFFLLLLKCRMPKLNLKLHNTILYRKPEQLSWYSNEAMCWTIVESWVNSWQMQDIFLFSAASRLLLGPIQPTIQQEPWVISLGVKFHGTTTCVFMVRCLINHEVHFASCLAYNLVNVTA